MLWTWQGKGLKSSLLHGQPWFLCLVLVISKIQGRYFELSDTTVLIPPGGAWRIHAEKWAIFHLLHRYESIIPFRSCSPAGRDSQDWSVCTHPYVEMVKFLLKPEESYDELEKWLSMLKISKTWTFHVCGSSLNGRPWALQLPRSTWRDSSGKHREISSCPNTEHFASPCANYRDECW